METLSDKEIVLLQYLLKQSATSALQESTQSKYDALHAKLGRIKAFQQSVEKTGEVVQVVGTVTEMIGRA